jgi:parallel beta-helix repeat protein
MKVSRNLGIGTMSGAIVGIAVTISALAGDLNPPAGPITPTFKTLTEVEPRIAINATNTPGDANSLFKIIQPGSYYLTGNITGAANKHGIEIAASGVTLDLNGFDLAGVAGMGSFDGVSATVANLRNIAVVNGSVRNWGRDGVNLGTVAVTGCRIEGVRADGNVRAGVYAGVRSQIANCSGGGGQYGVLADDGSTLSNCSASGNTSVGISADEGCLVSYCSAYQNSGDGIFASAGSTVERCTARNNTLRGIVCSSGCTIRENTCANNGFGAGNGANINALGADSRIEGNTCTGADRGIEVPDPGNIIIKNTCSGNSVNWVIVAGNAYGPIVATPAGAAVNGNTAAAALGSADPNANFSY